MDVAEILAVTWKEKRAEISRLQKARKFQQVKEMKRQFRVEVEEIKKKTKCHKCQKMGHWARECPNKGFASRPAGSKPAAFLHLAPLRVLPWLSLCRCISSQRFNLV